MKIWLRGLQWILSLVAIAALAWCGFVLWDTYRFQDTARSELAARVETPIGPSIAEDGMIGRLDIARLGVSAAVFEGTDDITLRRALGHIAGTGLPGQAGNIGISGHRDTFFRPLRDIRKDDVVGLTTPMGEYRYRVVSTRIVRPSEVGVLAPGRNEVLTLVTCYPFYYIGPAPRRFVVRAERIGFGG